MAAKLFFDPVTHWGAWLWILGTTLAVLLSIRIYYTSQKFKLGAIAEFSKPFQTLLFGSIVVPLVLMAIGFLIFAYHFFRCHMCGTIGGICGAELIWGAIVIDIGLISLAISWIYIEKIFKSYKMI